MRFTFLTFLLLISFYSSTVAQTKRHIYRDNTTKKYLKTMAVDKKLLLRGKHHHRQNRIKLGATVNLTLKDSVKPGLAVLKLIADSGMFVTPAIYRTDSFLIDTLLKKYITSEYIVRDTIVYFKYSDIIHIDYRNNFKRKYDNALSTAIIGGELVILPVILVPILSGSYDGFEILWPMYGAGLAMTAWGYFRLKHLRNLKSYSMNDWRFSVKDRFRNK